LSPHILQRRDLVLIDARHDIDLLRVSRLRWYLPLRLQQPLLKLGILRLHVVLKVNDSMGTDIHLLMSDVEQHMGVVPSMLGVTKMMENLL
jgi:hypothetical protein